MIAVGASVLITSGGRCRGRSWSTEWDPGDDYVSVYDRDFDAWAKSWGMDAPESAMGCEEEGVWFISWSR